MTYTRRQIAKTYNMHPRTVSRWTTHSDWPPKVSYTPAGWTYDEQLVHAWVIKHRPKLLTKALQPKPKENQ